MEILNFILIIYLFVQITSIKRKIVGDKEPQVTQTAPLVTQSIPLNQDESTNFFSQSIVWLREDWMLKLGGFFMLLAAGWFVTYAFMNNWIGEMGRIVLGIFIGCIFMAWGTLRIKKIMREGEILLAIGGIILVISIFAGQHLYKLYPESLALFAMTFVAFVIATIAYISKREILAVLGVLMIGISPLLVGYDSITPNITGLLSYLLCMSFGVLWLSKVTGWRSVTFLTTIIVFAYVYPYFTQYYEYTQIDATRALSFGQYINPQKLPIDVDILRFFAIIFSIIFNISAFMSLLFTKKATRDDFILIAVSSGFVAFSLFMLGTPSLLIFELVVVALIYMIFALTLTKITSYSYYVELYATVSILFLISATLKAVKLDLLPTFLSAESIILMIFYRYVFGTSYPLISIVPYGASFLISFFGIADVGKTLPSFIGFVSTVISTYFPYIIDQFDNKHNNVEKHKTIRNSSLVLGNILTSIGFYNFVENLGGAMQLTQSLIKGIRYSTYAIIGSFLYFTSRSSGHKIKYYFGIGFIIYVVASLLLYEVWMMDIAARIVIFFLIGLLFISSIYFLKMYEKK